MKKAAIVLSVFAFIGMAHGATTNMVLNLNGGGDYVNIPYNPVINQLQTLTCEAWFKPSSSNVGQTKIIWKDAAGGVGGFSLEWEDGTINGKAFPNPTPWTTVGKSNNVADTWYHAAITLDGTNLALYVGSELVGTTGCVALTQGTYPIPLRFGSWWETFQSEGYYFSGQIDEIRIWDRALSQCEIKSTMYKRLAGTETNLVGYWSFDDGTANDATTNHLDGSFANNAVTIADTAITNQIYWAVEIPFISGSPLTQYQLQYSTDLLSSNWFSVGDPVRGTGLERSLFDAPRGASPRFYKVISTY